MQDYKYQSVLLVDDSYVDNLINRKMLQSFNFAKDVTVIDSPLKALAYVEQCIDENMLPDVIFLDIRMPEMDGFKFLNILEELPGIKHSGITIYMLSSSLDPDDYRQIIDNPMVSKFFSKPLTEKILKEIG